MILADTSVWIDYFREDLPDLGERLRRREVVMHPFVVGELACGNFSNPEATLALLQQRRSVTFADTRS
jgi:predicted nucleic acid-binding protein